MPRRARRRSSPTRRAGSTSATSLPSPALKGRKNVAQGNALAPTTVNAPSPERAKDGELPGGWELARFDEAVEPSGGPRSAPRGQDQRIPFIPMALLPNDGVPTSRWEMRAPEDVRSGVPFRDGDVLLAKITPCLENGKLGVARGIPGGWGMTSTEVYPLRGERVTTDFLALFLSTPSVRLDLASKMQGATGRQRLPKEALDAFPIPVPPLPEQRAIAAVLRTVQRAKEGCERVIAATRQLKASLMRHLFTYGPVPFDQADKVPLKETEIGPMPERWKTASLGELAELVQYGTSSRCEPDAVGNPVLRIPNVVRGAVDCTSLKYLSASPVEVQRHKLETGDLLFVRTNGVRENVGRCAVYDGEPQNALFASYLIRTRLIVERAMPKFVQVFTETGAGRASFFGRASGAADGKFNINSQTIRATVIPLPPLPEQHDIAARLSAVETKLSVEEARRAALEVLFESLLHHLMTGKVRVPGEWLAS